MKSQKIVVIDNYDSFVFNLVRYIEELSHQDVIVMRNDQIDEKGLNQADTIILSPGPGIPSEAGDLMTVIERSYQSKKILGVCLGHQALGQFFQYPLVQCDQPIHGRATPIRIESTSTLFKELGDELEVGRYHSWKLVDHADGELVITARSKVGEIMAFQHETLPIYGVQYHPESILTPTGRQQILNFLNE